MKRTLFVMAVVLGFATAASAATLSVVSDQASYTVGDTITLTVTGDAQGGTAYSLLGRLIYSGTGGVTPQTQIQNSPGAPWIAGPLTNGPGFSESFNLIDGSFAGSTAVFPGGVVSVVTLLAAAPGSVNVDWFNNLSFYDRNSGNTAGTSFTIVPIPEPTTAVLLGLGLFGLALGGRRRS